MRMCCMAGGLGINFVPLGWHLHSECVELDVSARKAYGPSWQAATRH